METHVTFKQMDATDGLKSHIEEANAKISKYFDDNGTLRAKVSWICFLEGDDHVADLNVHIGQQHYFAKGETKDMYRSIEEATDKIERQLKKFKEMNHGHGQAHSRRIG